MLAVLFVGVLMGALDIAIVGPALPAIQAQFQVDDRALPWIFTIYVLFSLVGTPLMAKLSDLFGRRPIYVMDVTLFALGSLAVAVAPTFSLLLVGRAVQGVAAGGIFPVASATIGDTFPPDKRGSALGLIGAVFGLAFLIGPILGGALLMVGWQWLFIVNLPVALLLIVFSLRTLPAERAPKRRPFDWAGMVMLGGLLAAMTYGLNHIDTAHVLDSLISLNVWPFLVLTLVLLPLFWRVERDAEDPVLRTRLFHSRQVVLASILAIGTGLEEAGLVFIPKVLVMALGVEESTASFMLVPVVLIMAINSPIVGRLLDRHGSKVVIVAGSTCLTLGMIMLGSLPIALGSLITAGLFIGVGLSALLGAPLRYIMLNEASSSDRAAAQGAISLFTRVGQILGGAVVGAVAESQGGGIPGYRTAYLLLGALMLLLTVAALGLKSRTEELATLQGRHNASPA
ncbi:MAG: MFS transporter [Ardenticatenia bacterium]|nr:MFS transporter [Ardenticatenia bacterium]